MKFIQNYGTQSSQNYLEKNKVFLISNFIIASFQQVCCQNTGVMKTATKSKAKVGKTHPYIVIPGHGDSGRCITTAHPIYQRGVVESRTTDKISKETAEMGKSSFKNAWVASELAATCQRADTMDISLWTLEISNYYATEA